MGASFGTQPVLRKEMLINTRLDNSDQTHFVKKRLLSVRSSPSIEEPAAGASYEPDQGAYFLFTKDAGRNEFAQLHRFNAAGFLMANVEGHGSRWKNTNDLQFLATITFIRTYVLGQ